MQTAFPIDPHWPALLEHLTGVLDLKASARASGALLRRRAVADAATLLRLALAHGPGGLSLRSAAAWAGLAGVASLSDVALRKRLRGAADWLGQIAGALLPRRSPGSAAFAGRRLRVVDSTSFSHPGARGTCWRVHAAYEPAAGRFSDLRLTGAEEGEGFARLDLAAGDVLLGDRGYARPKGLQHVLASGADFIVRVGCASLRIVEPDGVPLDWAGVFGALSPGETAELQVMVTPQSEGRGLRLKPLFPARLIILRHRHAVTGERARRTLRRNQSRRQSGMRLQRLTIASTDYLMVLTSLPAAVGGAAEVLAAYRLRWQIELAFKRLKGGLGMDRLLARDGAMARSWLLSHLILALLVADAAEEVLRAPATRRAGPARPVSVWRLHGALRRTLLGAVLRRSPAARRSSSGTSAIRRAAGHRSPRSPVSACRHRAGGGVPALPFPSRWSQKGGKRPKRLAARMSDRTPSAVRLLPGGASRRAAVGRRATLGGSRP